MHLTIIAATVQTDELDTTARADPHISDVFKQAIASLAEMTPYHHIAEQAPHVLGYLAKKWNINVDVDTGAALNPEEYERVTKPFAASLNAFMSTIVVQDSIFHCGNGKEAAESVEDPLFWPFLMHRRPMLSKGKGLEEAGFAVL